MNADEKLESFKRQLLRLRGKPIRTFVGDPLSIPCHETSDAERLCKSPVVSVHMLAYNHEPYIRRAIEGVMMQKTDFEFELVIGEDCSTDKTREICFEYQKKHPDKIRVLWSEENLCQHPHPAGGNSRRVHAHCRGEFVAFCEGDDFWTRPDKLQLQVDAFRADPKATICYTDFSVFYSARGMTDEHILRKSGFLEKWRSFTAQDWVREQYLGMTKWFMATASIMIRRSCLENYLATDFAKKALALGDQQLRLYGSLAGNTLVVPEDCATYREGVGVLRRFSNSGSIVLCVDSMLVTCEFEPKLLTTDVEKRNFVISAVSRFVNWNIRDRGFARQPYLRLCRLSIWAFAIIPAREIPKIIAHMFIGVLSGVFCIRRR